MQLIIETDFGNKVVINPTLRQVTLTGMVAQEGLVIKTRDGEAVNKNMVWG